MMETDVEKYNPQLKEGTTLSRGKYEIVRTVAVGGFGIVYYVRECSTAQFYAIKEYFPAGFCRRQDDGKTVIPIEEEIDLFTKYLKRFLTEAKLIRSLDHPSIIKVFDYFQENGTAYFVMPYIKGHSLTDIVNSKGPLSQEQFDKYLEPLMDAVEYIHKRHILHRDIKPDNVLVTDEGKVILIDFGSAREFVNDKVQEHTAILTRGYAPPEQYSKVSKKGNYTDIYSVGAVMYFCLTGEVPIEPSARAVDSLKTPRSLNPRVSPSESMAVMKALNLNPQKRFQNVKDLRDAFKSTIVFEENPQSLKINNKLLLVILAVIGCILIAVLVILMLHKSPTKKDAPVEEVAVEQPIEFKLPGEDGETYTYEGNTLDGVPHGEGTATFTNSKFRKSYTGGFQNGKMYGQGELTTINGDVIKGRFEDNDLVEGEWHTSKSYYSGTFEHAHIIDGFNIDTIMKKKYIYKNGKVSKEINVQL